MMRSEGRGSSRMGVRGAALVAIALVSMMFLPALAAGVEAKVPTAPAPANTGAPKLTGTPAVGKTLTCSTGAWANNPTGYSYTWLRNGVTIAGQNGSVYVVQKADEGNSISCRVTAANEGGDYTISSLPSGSFKVAFYVEGEESGNYLEQFFNGKAKFAEANSVAVSAPGATGGINAELDAGGQVTGRVVDFETKAPLKGIDVCAYASSEEFFGGCAYTNANGEYAITGLGNGSYYVEFYSDYVEGGGYIDELYNGQSLDVDATLVSVTAPNTTGGINAELLPTSDGGQLSGTVTGPSKVALTNSIEVCAYQIKGDGLGCTTTSGGSYTISGLLSGNYEVEFDSTYEGGNYTTQYYEGKSSPGEATPVPVVEGKIKTLNPVELHAGGQITGKVTGAGKVALAGIEACAVIAGTQGPESCASTNSNGEYTISSLSGAEYAVDFSVESDSANYVAQYYSGKNALAEANLVKVAPEATTTGIDVEMHPGGTVAGRVTDGSTHTALENIEVCVHEISGKGTPLSCRATNASGEYTIADVSPGSHTVEFTASSEKVNYKPQYEVVSVNENATTEVSPEMHPGGQITGRVTDASTHAGLTKIVACAEDIEETEGFHYESCADTTAGVASANATSNALAIPVPNSTFTLAKAPYFESKTDDLVFFFKVANAGKFSWSLSFKNSDVGFASAVESSVGGVELALAEASKKKSKSKKCKAGEIKHDGKCVHATVPFSNGSQSVSSGTVEIKVHASSRAIKGLKAGHTLHVSGPFTFVSALGGSPVAHIESAAVKLPKPKKKSSKKHGKK